ncbi:MAG: hypothetical protein NUV88_02540 [Candidatus Kaiserbacteria bacterium]|nr:hypothetical protein [Candidatus Kaiserbacteria bacterium]
MKMKNQAIDDISKYAAPHRDRWHYLDYSDGKHTGAYTEWKYLNFIQGDLAGYIIYYVLDPELRTSLGSGRIMARVLRGEEFHGGIDKIPMSEIEFDTHTASARFGNARLNEKTPHNYQITGSVAGISWDLEYNQSTPTLDGFKDVNFGILPWEKASWLVKMPRARITGAISINSKHIQLNALGYSDTNWGEFVPFLSRYEWAQFNDEKISVVLGVIYRWGAVWKTYAYAEINKEIINFDSETFKIIERKWGREKITGIMTPVKTRFEIKGGPSTGESADFVARPADHGPVGPSTGADHGPVGPYTLDCAYAPARTDMLSLKISSWLPKPCVAEQISRFSGTLKHNGNIVHSFAGLGFSEYSPKTWKNTAVTF